MGCRVLLLAYCLASSLAIAECTDTGKVPGLSSLYSEGWGIDLRNTRYQPRSTLDSNNVANLKLKWAYGLGNTTPRSHPLVTEDTIYIGDTGRGLVALARETGCERWVHKLESGLMSSAIVPGMIGDRQILVFAERFSGVYAIDAVTGARIWHSSTSEEAIPQYSGTPLVTDTMVFLPVASQEVAYAINPFYGCCTTSGGMAAFDINTGEQIWYLDTIPEEAKVTGSHFFFVEEYGPSGAPVWATPAYDERRGLLYFGTGQNYTHPTTGTSDAIFAVDAKTGEVRWLRQFTANDTYTAACNISLNFPNCPQPVGPDVDFGAPTLLVTTTSGRDLLLAGQKSSEVHAMDPDTGEVVWSTRLGRGGIIGGVHHGLAVNEALGLVFVPISDKAAMGYPSPGEPAPGLYALDLQTGEQRWHFTRESRCPDEACVYGLSSAITATNDIIVTGSMDGMLEINHAQTGRLLWSHDAWRDYEVTNGVVTEGGAFDSHGPMLADDLLLVSSGYSYVARQKGGNALLVFQLEAANE